MDPSMSGTISQSSSDDTVHSSNHSNNLPPPHHSRRHARYAPPDSSSPPPPHLVLEAALQPSRDMSAPPSPPPAIASSSNTHQSNDSIQELEIDGQDHDRMEMDEEDSEGSDSSDDGDTEADEPAGADVESELPNFAEEDGMDTTPDNPPATRTHASVGVLMDDEAIGESTTLRVVHIDVDGHHDAQNAPRLAQPDIILAPSDHLPPGTEAAERTEGAGTAEPESAESRRPEQRDRARQRRVRRENDEDGEGDGDDDSDDSTDEEEHPYWTNFREDESTPDERELKVIEETTTEISALDHEYWKRQVFESLDDPEYIPAESGCISWTVVGVHGTPEKPNRETIMRSPSVLIGGYYWNIKYFPRGHEGSEMMSVFIECSPTPYEEAKPKSEHPPVPNTASPADQIVGAIEETNENVPSDTEETRDRVRSPEDDVSVHSMEEDFESTPTPRKDKEPENQKSWGVAAQFSCVAYNPNEPRVHAHQKSCHRYENDNPDWGWTRFWGPWDELHKRQRLQRQALIRKDTLAFTVYIRIIKDESKALFWHAPKDKPEWNSLAVTGVRAFQCDSYQSSAMVAALSAWLHLSPVVDLIRNTHVPDPVLEPEIRMRPVFQELQNILNEAPGLITSNGTQISLANLLKVLKFYGVEVDYRMDVVMIWETFRRLMNFEASGLGNIEKGNSLGNELFGEVLLLKQPDLLNKDYSATRYSALPYDDHSRLHDSEPTSVDETIQRASKRPENSFRVWESFAEQPQMPPINPLVLQIELHRRDFSKEARKWKKLTHRIKLDETLTFNSQYYVLYGMIVHSGDLESNEYYSIIRPEGPGTRWLKYAGDNSARRVTILTTKQAVEAHEGGENLDGNAAVAYVVMYVPINELPHVLCTPFKHDREKTTRIDVVQEPAPRADSPMDSRDPEETITVFIYDAEIFKKYYGRGIFDPWSYNIPSLVRKVKFPASTTLQQVHAAVTRNFARDEQRLLLWPISTMPSNSSGPYPLLMSFKHYSEDQLGMMVENSGGCRFWMDYSETYPLVVTEGELPPPAPTQVESTTDRSEPRVQSSLVSDDTEMTEAPNATPVVHESEASEAHPDPPVKGVYFLVKLFSAESQTLCGVGTHVAKREAKISEEVKKVLRADVDEALDIYAEPRLQIKAKHAIKVNETFQHRFGDGGDGVVLVAQRRPTAAQYVRLLFVDPDCFANVTCRITSLEADRKCTNVVDYFVHLRGLDDPTFFRSYSTSSYFGRDYKAFSVQCGRPNGIGTLITLSGDAYTGNFLGGVKSGEGTMDYANGDTYTGQWKANEPNGHGRMIYAKTGNVYIGGFKKRKRHGKGMMEFQVADEEMQLCKICYENEQDALFYDCGHVTSCEECARQLDACPICRKSVRAVVKIWRT